MAYTFTGLALLLVLLVLVFRKHPRTRSVQQAQALRIQNNGDMKQAYDNIQQCATYVDDQYIARCQKLLARFNEVYLETYQYDKAPKAVETMYGIKKTLHKALLDVRYRMPQDAKMVRRLNEAAELLDYAIRRRLTDAEARTKSVPYSLPLGCYDYARYVRASNDKHVVDKMGIV